jgi:ribosomal protein S12 methylthiotransferase accessory factor YcaO
MRLFRRRRGRHDLGAAVRDIPSALPVVLVHPPAPVPSPVEVPAQEAPLDVVRHRVELGFRDGSVAALAPDSAQARALTELAQVLVRKD